MTNLFFVVIFIICLTKTIGVSSNPVQKYFPQRSPLEKDLFGGSAGKWDGDDWVAFDDRVRGGKSKSHLTPSSNAHTAMFHGALDIKELGDAGFASQRTSDRKARHDLSLYRGITFTYTRGDRRTYSLNLYDKVAPKKPDGKHESIVEYKFLFNATSILHRTFHIPWTSFVPYYHGREKNDAEPLDISNIRSISIMIQSMFGKQKGKFCVEIAKIGAYGEERFLEDVEEVREEEEVQQDEMAPEYEQNLTCGDR